MSVGKPLVRLGAAIVTGPSGRNSLFEFSPAVAAMLALCRELSTATGLAVEPRPFERYAQVLEALDANEVELVWLPPIPALSAMRGSRIVPVALPVRSGATTFGSALFARDDGRVRNLVDLVGVRAAWVDEQSAAGYVVIRAALRARGIDLRAAFGQELFFGSHDAVVEAVVSGDVDVGATHVHFSPDGAGVARAGWGARRVRIVALAGPIPADMLAVSAAAPHEVRDTLAAALLRAPNVVAAARALLDAEALVAVPPEHVETLSALAVHLETVIEDEDTTLPPDPE